MQNGGLSEFIFLIFATVQLLGLFLMSSAALFSLFTLVHKQEDDFGWMAALSFGFGPVALSWCFTMTLRLFPGHSSSSYVWGMFIVTGLLSLWRLPTLIRFLGKTLKYLMEFPKNRWARLISLSLAFLSFLILLGLALIAAFLPLTGNDALGYAQAARLIAEARSVDIYPFMDTAKSGGFYAPWTHPLGYINLLTIGYMVQGSTEVAGVIRFVAPYFAFASGVAIWHYLSRHSPISGVIAALLLLSTPLYFHMTAQSHIDTLRIFTFMGVFIALYHHLQHPNYGTAIIVGFTVGMSHYSHSSAILTLLILIPLYLIVSGQPLKKMVPHLGIIIILGIGLVLPRWLTNIELFGSLAADQVKIWTFPEIHFKEHLAAVRQMTTPLDKVYYGLLKGFSFPFLFGPIYYLFVVALLWMIHCRKPHRNIMRIWQKKLWQKPGPVLLSLWVLAGFYGIVILSILLGKDLIIKNGRYILTVQPFVCVVVAHMLSIMITSKSSQDRAEPSATSEA